MIDKDKVMTMYDFLQLLADIGKKMQPPDEVADIKDRAKELSE